MKMCAIVVTPCMCKITHLYELSNGSAATSRTSTSSVQCRMHVTPCISAAWGQVGVLQHSAA